MPKTAVPLSAFSAALRMSTSARDSLKFWNRSSRSSIVAYYDQKNSDGGHEAMTALLHYGAMSPNEAGNVLPDENR